MAKFGLDDVFVAAGQALETALRAAVEEEERIEIAENFLRSRHPERDDALAVDWPALAADLGYFDQAHFIKRL